MSVPELIPNTYIATSDHKLDDINGTHKDLNNGMLLDSSWAVVIIGGFDPGAIVDDNGVDGDNIFGPQAVFLGIEKTISGCACTF